MKKYEVKMQYTLEMTEVDFVVVEAECEKDAIEKAEDHIRYANEDAECKVTNTTMLDIWMRPDPEYFYILITIGEKSHNTYIDFCARKRANLSKEYFMQKLYKEIERRAKQYMKGNCIPSETGWTYTVEDWTASEYYTFSSFEC